MAVFSTRSGVDTGQLSFVDLAPAAIGSDGWSYWDFASKEIQRYRESLWESDEWFDYGGRFSYTPDDPGDDPTAIAGRVTSVRYSYSFYPQFPDEDDVDRDESWSITGLSVDVSVFMDAEDDDIVATLFASHDRMTGSDDEDTLRGFGGNDSLDGGGGKDTMAGGAGNDRYYVRQSGDVVQEASRGGTDEVFSYLTRYTLGANVENGAISHRGTASITGNALANTLYAGDGANSIDGAGGIDTLSFYYGANGTGVTASLATGTASGGSGADTFKGIERLAGSDFDDRLTGNAGANVLTGHGGADRLDGGAGIDTMAGGGGNDRYLVRDAADAVREAAAQGHDEAYSYLARYTLAANVEEGHIVGSAAGSLTGNGLDNLLYAGEGNNTIAGGAGTDTLSFDQGNNGKGVTANLSTGVASGGSGRDTFSSIERLWGTDFGDQLSGNAGANYLRGHGGNDTLAGGSGNDTLLGEDGRDSLSGGRGNDVFDFNALSQTGSTAGTCDVIRDFVRGQDRIDLRTLDARAATATNDSFVFIGKAGFSADATGQVRWVHDSARASVILYGSTDADRTAEFAIELQALTSFGAADLLA